jgi:hypothetical protein
MVAVKRAIYASPERVRPTLSSGSVLSASISTGEATLNELDRDVHYQLPAVGTHAYSTRTFASPPTWNTRLLHTAAPLGEVHKGASLP